MVAVGDIVYYSDDTIDYGDGPALTQIPMLVIKVNEDDSVSGKVFYISATLQFNNIPYASSFTSGYWTEKS